MSWRWLWEQGTEALTLTIQAASCPVCQGGLYRNSTFLSGGWARCAACSEVVHYSCLSGGRFLKHRPRICRDCKAGRARTGQTMPSPPPGLSPMPDVSGPVPDGVPSSSAPSAPASP